MLIGTSYCRYLQCFTAFHVLTFVGRCITVHGWVYYNMQYYFISNYVTEHRNSSDESFRHRYVEAGTLGLALLIHWTKHDNGACSGHERKRIGYEEQLRGFVGRSVGRATRNIKGSVTASAQRPLRVRRYSLLPTVTNNSSCSTHLNIDNCSVFYAREGTPFNPLVLRSVVGIGNSQPREGHVAIKTLTWSTSPPTLHLSLLLLTGMVVHLY